MPSSAPVGSTFALWPTVLHEQGLVAAITPVVEQTGREIGAKVSISAPTERFERRIEEVVFRTIQEAVANIRKHSRANQIIVSVRLVGNRLVSVIDDDGRGFDVSTPQNLDGIPHMGLAAMRERVRMSGGTIHIDSSHGSGTMVTFAGATLSTRHTVRAATFRSGRLCLR